MFSYLERVHALPVLVQVVHEIHDDDGKKRISAAECENFVGENGLSNETNFLHICVV